MVQYAKIEAWREDEPGAVLVAESRVAIARRVGGPQGGASNSSPPASFLSRTETFETHTPQALSQVGVYQDPFTQELWVEGCVGVEVGSHRLESKDAARSICLPEIAYFHFQKSIEGDFASFNRDAWWIAVFMEPEKD